MSAEFKPGDRVRVTRAYFDKLVAGKTGRVLAGPTEIFWPVAIEGSEFVWEFKGDEIEPAPAAPASEPEMREGCPVKALAYLTPHERTAEQAPVVLTAGKVRESVAALARHLADRDARIAELERCRQIELENATQAADACQCRIATLSSKVIDLETRARAAEAALAEEREANAKLAEDLHDTFDGFPYDGGGGTTGYNCACLDIAAAIRARTITAEGAETGSAEHG